MARDPLAVPRRVRIRRRFWKTVDQALAKVRLGRLSQRPVIKVTSDGHLTVTFPNKFRWSGRLDYHHLRRFDVVPNPELEPEPCD